MHLRVWFDKFELVATLIFADNKLKEFPNDRIDILASLLHIDICNNRIEEFPVDFPYLYRLETILARYSRTINPDFFYRGMWPENMTTAPLPWICN